MSQSTACRSLSAYLAVNGAREAMDFYKDAFGAVELYALVDPSDGRIGHAELQFGDSMVMLSDEYPDFGALSPDTLGGSPVKLHISVDDVDAMFARALERGCTEVRPVRDQFFGDRTGTLVDPFGYTWSLATKVRDVSPKDMQALWAKEMNG